MTDRYVDSNAAGVADGSSWTDAWLTLAAAAAGSAAGDTIYVASDHDETLSASTTYNWPGSSFTNRTRILSADKTSGSPPTTLQAGAIIRCDHSTLNFASAFDYMYAYGLEFIIGSGSSSAFAGISFAGSSFCRLTYDTCTFRMLTTHASGRIVAANASLATVHYIDCQYEGNHAAHGWTASNAGMTYFRNLKVLDTDVTNGLFAFSSTNCFVIEALDLSSANAAINVLAGHSNAGNGRVIGVRPPASWTGSMLATGSGGSGTRFQAWDGDEKQQEATSAAFEIPEYTLIKTGGAEINGTGLSRKVTATTTGVSFPESHHSSHEFSVWHDGTSEITVTVDILRDSATALKDNQVWLEVLYPVGTDAGLALASSREPDPIGAGTDIPASAASWTTTGMTNPNEQEMSVTFTPGRAGFLVARVCSALTSGTFYYDPLIQVA